MAQHHPVDQENNHLAVAAAHRFLSTVHQSIHTALMPVHTHLFGIRTAGNRQARAFERSLSRYQESAQMPPMGRKWLRPGAITIKPI
jgi:hypothetical protein